MYIFGLAYLGTFLDARFSLKELDVTSFDKNKQRVNPMSKKTYIK